MAPASPAAPHPVRLAVWYGKGGVGKSTTTMMLALFAARRGHRVLVVDVDPECGTSRNFLGPEVSRLRANLVTFLQSPIPEPLPVVPSGVERLDLVANAPEQQRFFRLYPEGSKALRDGLAMLPPAYDWIIMDVPNQFDNVAHLGLIAADHLILPVELTADCVERVPTVLWILKEAQAANPSLKVLGALALGAVPSSGREKKLSAKERLVYREYEAAFREAGIPMFSTIMFRSATTVEEARSNAADRLLHWTARRRFKAFCAEVAARLKALSLSPPPRPDGTHDRRHAKQGRAAAAANR